MPTDASQIRIEIIEDATAGMSIRLHNNGRFPDLLAEFDPNVVRRARPWFWNGYERKVLRHAQMLSPQNRRLVRDLLVAERARALIAAEARPKPLSWLQRRRQALAQREGVLTKAGRMLPSHRVDVRATLADGRPEPDPPMPERVAELPPRRAVEADRSVSSTAAAPERRSCTPPRRLTEVTLAERMLASTGLSVVQPQRDRSRDTLDRSR